MLNLILKQFQVTGSFKITSRQFWSYWQIDGWIIGRNLDHRTKFLYSSPHAFQLIIFRYVQNKWNIIDTDLCWRRQSWDNILLSGVQHTGYYDKYINKSMILTKKYLYYHLSLNVSYLYYISSKNIPKVRGALASKNRRPGLCLSLRVASPASLIFFRSVNSY